MTADAPWDVVFFSSADFTAHTQRPQAVARGLARSGARVLYVDNLGLRLPRFSDRRRAWRRLVAAARPTTKSASDVNDDIEVVSPLIPPVEHWRPARQLAATRLAARAARWRQPSRPLVVWTYLPNPAVADVAATLGATALVYEYADFASVRMQAGSARHRARVGRWEDEMLERADVVFVPSEHLLVARGLENARARVVAHGVPLGDDRKGPPVLDRVPRPRVVFVGSIGPVVDVELIGRLAGARKGWAFVLIGPVHASVRPLTRQSNVWMMGERPHRDIPGLLDSCDVGIVPYREDVPGIGTATPLKLREYLAAGLPVVSVDIPDARQHEPDVIVASGFDAFLAALDRAVASGRRPRSRPRPWADAVTEMVRHLVAAHPALASARHESP